MKNEKWNNLPGYDYIISDAGNVARSKPSKGTRANRPVKPSVDRGGRHVFNVSKDGKVKQFKLHRAVMLAFTGECPDGMEVAHLDGDQSNNALNNLKYVTPKENNSHKVRHGTQPMGEDIWMAILTERQVLDIREAWPSLSYSKLAEQYSVHVQTIASIITRKNWKHI